MKSRTYLFAAWIGLASAASHADPLPYWITIDSASAASALSLKNVVEGVSAEWFKLPAGERTVGRFQDLFEKDLFTAVDHLGPAPSSTSRRQATQAATAKWLSHYSMDASVESDRLDALQEMIRSMQFLDTIQSAAPAASSDVWNDVAQESQWCGPSGPGCAPGQLFKLATLDEEPTDLYQDLLDRIQSAKNGELSREQIHLLSYQILWAAPLDTVRYGVTIYFDEDASSGVTETCLLGHDLIYANTATPAAAGPEIVKPQEQTAAAAHPGVWEAAGWVNRAVAYPIGVVIGVKNAAFEVAKMPFSFIGGFLGRGHAWQYPVRDLQMAWLCLTTEIAHPHRIGLLRGLWRLVGETPLIGPVFQTNENPNRQRENSLQKIYVTRGIYGGDETDQDTGLWVASAHAFYPAARVEAAPYEFGTITDVIWSMFDLSHGPAYAMAHEVMMTANPGDRLYLAGHSAGVQRITMTSRLLNYRGYDVRQMVGIAGPSIGQAAVNTNRPEPFKLLLNPGGDIVSVVGLGAWGVATLADYGIRRPIKLTGDVALSWDGRKQAAWDRWIDRTGMSDAIQTEVVGGLPASHDTPFSLSLTTRLVYDRYIREEFQDAFRDDLSPTPPQPKDQVISYQP